MINDHAITGGKVVNVLTSFFDYTTDLMTKNLRNDIEGNRLPILVGVVVGVAGEDVGVGAAKAHRRNAHHDFMRAGDRLWNIAHLDPLDAAEHTGAHRRA
jgi:hypothetical protein